MSQLDELEKLHELKEKGILNDAEFEAQKKALLNKNTAQFEDKPMIPMKEAYALYWKNSFKWSGRATRAEYWWPVLVNILISIVAGFVADNIILGIAMLAFSIANIFPGLAVYVRRMHDRNKSAWFAFAPLWLFLGTIVVAIAGAVMDYISAGVSGGSNFRSIFFIVMGFLSVISWIVMLVYTILPGTKGPNRYGDPR